MPFLRALGLPPVLTILLFSAAILVFLRSRYTRRATSLSGPANPSLLWGWSRAINDAQDSALLFERWVHDYGHIFRLPAAFYTERVVLFDPHALAHVFSYDTQRYVQGSVTRYALEMLVGRGILSAEGDDHKKHRRTLSAGLTTVAVRKMVPVFLDSAYKAKAAWDALLESSPDNQVILDVQKWMNNITLDSMGIAAFSHDFGSLAGHQSPIADVFDSFGSVKQNLTSIIRSLLGPAIPPLRKLPTVLDPLIKQLHDNMEILADALLERDRNEGTESASDGDDKSIMRLLLRAEGEKLSKSQILAQMKTLMLAGYETTSISLTHCLIELARHPNIQDKLRDELLSSSSALGSYEEPSDGLSYLDAVVHEALRTHSALEEINRVATQDDIIPLLTPIRTRDGQTVDRIAVAKGTGICVPMDAVNRSTSIWGADAQLFRPERWLEKGGISDEDTKLPAKHIQAYRHLLTFIDGPRTCLGKAFTIAQFKSVLSVLVRSYSFELPKGPETKIVRHAAILRRPKVEGEEGARVPLRIRPVESR